MELKESNIKLLEFKFEDVIFLVKPEASEDDRMEIALSGRLEEKAGVPVITNSRAEFCKTAIRCMVADWKGIKRAGHDVPYSYDELKNFPHVDKRNIFLELGDFIIKNTDIVNRRADDLKKD